MQGEGGAAAEQAAGGEAFAEVLHGEEGDAGGGGRWAGGGGGDGDGWGSFGVVAGGSVGGAGKGGIDFAATGLGEGAAGGEAAAGEAGQGAQAGHLVGQGVEVAQGAGDGRVRELEAACVGVGGGGEDFGGGALFDGGAAVEDGDLVADFAGEAEVVGDEQDGGVVAGLELGHEVDDDGLDGDVECGGGFVGDDEAGAAGEGHGDEDALAHAAGELMGVKAEEGFGVRQVDGLEGGEAALVALAGVGDADMGEVFAHLLLDGEDGVEGGEGLLRDEGDVAAEEGAASRGGHGGEVGAVEGQDALGGGEAWRHELGDGAADHAFAGAGFADEAEDLAGGEGEGEVADDRDGLAGEGGGDGEVLGGQEGHEEGLLF